MNFKATGKINPTHIVILFLMTFFLITSCRDDDDNDGNNNVPSVADDVREAQLIVALGAREAGKSVEEFSGSSRSFPENFYVFLPSAISFSMLRDPNLASVRIPIYKGIGPSGKDTYFIITETSTMETSRILGTILSPKLRYGTLPGANDAVQHVMFNEGRITFLGDVDFDPDRLLARGTGNIFPPSVANPGALGDSEYSSVVVLPSGLVINAQIIYNNTGMHDRINEINIEERWVELQLLDGWQGENRYYYHLVTDASDSIAATIELGVYAPRLAKLPVFGQSELDGETMLLGFSPSVNGLTIDEINNINDIEVNRQGLASTIVDEDLDPVNIFPFDPDNSNEENNYSPLWDAHLNMWTPKAINGPNGEDQRRSIKSFEDLGELIEQGLVTSFSGSPPGGENEFIHGLRTSRIIINCPVICHPIFREDE